MKTITPLRITVLMACTMQLACDQQPESAPAPNVVEVTATYDASSNTHQFVTDIEEIPSGWTTFRLINSAPAIHFLVLESLPDSITVDNSRREVVPVFQQAMDLINDGQADSGFARLAELPDWYAGVRFMGGPGLASPGQSTEATVYLEPGRYMMECYVKSAEGLFHSSLGMTRGFTVTEERSNATPPSDVTLEMTLTNAGFGIEGKATPGHHTVAVHFAEANPPLLGNDVHLVKLGEGATIEDVTAWMDWSQPAGMVSEHDAAPAFQFVGGTQEMPQGSTAYFTVDLTEGRYAWVGERSAANPLFEEFTVAAR